MKTNNNITGRGMRQNHRTLTKDDDNLCEFTQPTMISHSNTPASWRTHTHCDPHKEAPTTTKTRNSKSKGTDANE